MPKRSVESSDDDEPSKRSRTMNESDSVTRSESDSDSGSGSGSDYESGDESLSEGEGEEDGVRPARAQFTEDQSFRLRAKYQALDEKLDRQGSKLTTDKGVEMVTQSLMEIDDIFKETKTSNQGTLAAKDASTLCKIGFQARIATKNVKLGRSNKLLDFDEFARKFNSRYARDTTSRRDELPRVNWTGVGLALGRVSRRAVTAEFLLGPLALARKQRAVRQRLQDDSRSAVTKTANSRDADEVAKREKADVTSINTEKLFRKIKTFEGDKIPLFQVFLDPASFGHSVENLFYTSFLISNEMVVLLKDDATNTLYVQEASKDSCADFRRFKEHDMSRSHVIFDLDFETWRGLVEESGVTEAFI